MIVQAIFDFKESAEEIFREESDLVADIGEDITREALDSMGMSRIDQRLFGKMDYKQARYNPNAVDGIWLAGRNAPSRREAFRVRLSFPKLKAKASWRVQSIPISAKLWQWTK